ncbi:MAG TPA: DUF4864 domain-containing protein [Parachlamydiaceae bacterium]|nr:DUF4864 domain-containing protein [Parachlamydiaceae bacterium]
MLTFRIIVTALYLFPFFLTAGQATNDIHTKKTVLSHTSRITPQPFLDAVDGQLKALRAKEIEKAYKDYTSAEFRKNTSLEDFQKLINNFKALSSNKLFQFQSFHVEDDIATLSGDAQSDDGDSIPVEYDFIMEDGKWKILGIQIYRNELSLPQRETN